MTISRIAVRLCAVPAAAAVLALSMAGPASAHVTISASTTAAGAFTVLTVSVPHGCDGSATTKVAVQIPEQIVSVTPTRNPFWTVDKKMVKLDEPITGEGGDSITERVGTVVYTAATPLLDGQRDAFELSLQLPDEAGTTLNFPTVQSCEEGQTDWTEIPAEGQDRFELDHPAPFVTITAAESEAAPDATTGENDSEDAEEDDESGALGWVGLGAGVLGLIAGGAALVQVRRKP